MSEVGLAYSEHHPILLAGDHAIVKLLIVPEDLHLLHAGPTLVAASLSCRLCILGSSRAIRRIVRSCVKCRCVSLRATLQLHGQLPIDRLNPGTVFGLVGIDYAGPILIKGGPIRKPIVSKAYRKVLIFRGPYISRISRISRHSRN